MRFVGLKLYVKGNIMYVIACDSQFNAEQTVFLVDRNKSKRKWWVTGGSSIMIFRNLDAAKLTKNKYKMNNPRIMTLEKANEAIRRNNELVEDRILDGDQSWDAHKDY